MALDLNLKTKKMIEERIRSKARDWGHIDIIIRRTHPFKNQYAEKDMQILGYNVRICATKTGKKPTILYCILSKVKLNNSTT